MSEIQSYVKFDSKDIDEFCKSLDYEGNGYICLLDIEDVCNSMGLEDVYQNVTSLLQPYCNAEKLGISVEDVKKVLNNDNTTMKEEIKEIFESFDYDNKKFINKNKLRINYSKLLNKEPTDEELEDMIKYLGKDDKVLLDDLYKLN